MNMNDYRGLTNSERVFADLIVELIAEIRALRNEVDS